MTGSLCNMINTANNELMSKIFSVRSENDFEKLALEVFNCQAHNNTIYSVYIESLKISPEAVVAVHAALRALAGICDGAASLDDMGFNRMDTHVGKSLATSPRLTAKQAALGRKIVLKYHRQLPADLLAIIKSAA